MPLPEEEAHHASRVVRVRPGERVALFDGRGREWLGRIERADRREVAVSIETERREEPPSAHLTLVQAWLKRDKHIEEIVWRGTELGVAQFVFFRAERSERPVSREAKWDRISLEACKQCGRLWRPEFGVAEGLREAVEGFEGQLLMAALDEKPVPLHEAVRGRRVGLIIGPEGDFSADELALARQHGAQPISLGAKTFRAEVAAVVASALVLYEMGGLGPVRK